MKYFIFLILFSQSIFALELKSDLTASEIYEQALFKKQFIISKQSDKAIVQQTFGANIKRNVIVGLILKSKPDRHINTQYEIINTDFRKGEITVHFKKYSDLRSFGKELEVTEGNFTVSFQP